MLDPKEIDIEISRLEYGESSYPAYAKLANLYTIRNQMQKQGSEKQDRSYDYSYSVDTSNPTQVEAYGNSEFLATISGLKQSDVWEIMDDLMDTLQVTNPRVYNGVMRKIRQL